MKDRHRNFEDKLRERLLNEDLSYDDGAWEKFMQSAETPVSDYNSDSRSSKNKSGLWRWMLLIFLLTVGGALGYYSLDLESAKDKTSINKNEQKPELNRNQLSKTSGDNKAMEKEVINDDASILLNEENGGFEQSSNILIDEAERQIQNRKDEKYPMSNLASEEFREVRDKASFLSEGGNENSSNSKDQDRFGEGVSISESNEILDNNFNLNFSNPIQPKALETDKDGKSERDSGLIPGEMDNSSSGKEVNESNLTNDKDKKIMAAVEEDENRWMIDMERLDLLKPSGLTLPKRADFAIQDFIIPLKYPKNEFYVGAGFVNSFSELSVGSDFGKAADTPVDITYYSLGYSRKFAPSWAFGVELNLAHIQNLNMSRSIRDYHQTSTSFEYIEGVMSHGHSNFVGLPITIRYQPLNSRLSIYGGASVAYAYATDMDFDVEFEGENPVVERLRYTSPGSEYVGKWDAGLLVGTSFRIWKGLEIEGRMNLGLVDLSDDFYWGEGRSTASTYRVGLKYRFLN